MNKQIDNRVLGRYDGSEKGPLLICLGAMHGNEPAGVRAIELVLKMLDVEPIKNPEFKFKGRFFGLIGNLAAYNLGQRFLKKDLNRQFSKSHYEKIKHLPKDKLDEEDKELIALIEIINKEVKDYQPEKLIVLDLHTTSSFGGIFTICQETPEIIQMATALHAPVVTGFLDGIKGTTLHYFTEQNTGVETAAITFESGQHEEALSVNRAIAGIICCMREIQAVNKEDVENLHEEILISYSKTLPKLTSLVEHHAITEEDNFIMNPGYKNFQKVHADEVIAKDKNGTIKTKKAGRILMPLYQKKGEDGYFIVKDVVL